MSDYDDDRTPERHFHAHQLNYVRHWVMRNFIGDIREEILCIVDALAQEVARSNWYEKQWTRSIKDAIATSDAMRANLLDFVFNNEITVTPRERDEEAECPVS